MTHEEYQAAANYWLKKDADSKKMPAARYEPVSFLVEKSQLSGAVAFWQLCRKY